MTGAQLLRMTRANAAGSWRIMSGVATSWRVAWSWPRIFHGACPHRVLAISSVPAVITPPLGELRLAVSHRDDLDAFAAGVSQPRGQGDRADLGDFVQSHQQRRVQAARI